MQSRPCPTCRWSAPATRYLQDYLPHVAQAVIRAGWIDMVGLGRMVLSYPELPADTLARGTTERKKVCRTFSDCTTAPRNGLPSGCYPLDPYYKQLPEAEELREVKQELCVEHRGGCDGKAQPCESVFRGFRCMLDLPSPERETAMLGIRYLKVAPTTYVLHYKGGKVRQEGPGLSFFYFAAHIGNRAGAAGEHRRPLCL